MVYTKRKIVKFGRSSHIISLPAGWMQKYGLDRGAYLEVGELPDGGLIIRPEIDKKPKKIALTHSRAFDIEPQLISAYLNGFTEIKLVSDKELDKRELDNLRRITRRLSGMETINEGKKFVEYTAYTEMGGIELMRETRRMELVISGMFDDIIEILNGRGKVINVAEKEDIVDRFYFLTCRQIMSLLGSPHEGVGNLDMLYHYAIVRAMERIGDHLASMGKNAEMLSKEMLSEGANGQIVGPINDMRGIFRGAFSCFFGGKGDLFDIIEKGHKLSSREFQLKVKPRDTIPVGRIMYSLRRIADHCVDIAEAVLNSKTK